MHSVLQTSTIGTFNERWMVNIKHVRCPGQAFSGVWQYGRHFGRLRTHAPASHAASHDDHENSNAWFS